jgi:hypothetical protein
VYIWSVGVDSISVPEVLTRDGLRPDLTAIVVIQAFSAKNTCVPAYGADGRADARTPDECDTRGFFFELFWTAVITTKG